MSLFGKKETLSIEIAGDIAKSVDEGKLIILGVVALNMKSDCLQIQLVDEIDKDEGLAILSKYFGRGARIGNTETRK